jgi:hypothetical protein
MARAVIFDFYGTLARWRDRDVSNYTAVLAARGYDLGDDVLDAYFARYDGIEHLAHSADQETYEEWVRLRLCDLTSACGVEAGDQVAVIDSLRASDQGPMVAYPEAAETLAALRDEGWAIGVCSNWGWDLDSFLIQVGSSRVSQASPGHLRPFGRRVGRRGGGDRLRGGLLGSRCRGPAPGGYDRGARLADRRASWSGSLPVGETLSRTLLN